MIVLPDTPETQAFFHVVMAVAERVGFFDDPPNKEAPDGHEPTSAHEAAQEAANE